MTDRLVNGTNGSHEGHSEPHTGADDVVEAQTSTVPTPTVTAFTLQELQELLERRQRQRRTARGMARTVDWPITGYMHGPTFNRRRRSRNPMPPLRREVRRSIPPNIPFFIIGTTDEWDQLCAEFPEEELNRTLRDDTVLTS
ncbi:hypothetical protein E4U15_001831 [Claviceps sp. LM218 group G6]|nr:hypothetical protein E4U15_001831 [Claviceps sp. LM218 group G6]